MDAFEKDLAISLPGNNSSCKIVYRLGAIASIILLAYCLATMFIFGIIGTPPKTIEECFSMLHANKLTGLLRLDILTVFIMPFYYLLFYSIYQAMKRVDHELLKISIILIFIGLTLFLSAPSVFSYLNLSEKYAAATTDIQRNQFLAAGEAIFATDIWHGTSAIIGGLMMQAGALMISFLMLRNNTFGKLIAYTGIFMYALDLMHILTGFFMPTLSSILMVIAGIFYLLWFPLIAIRLIRLGRMISE